MSVFNEIRTRIEDALSAGPLNSLFEGFVLKPSIAGDILASLYNGHHVLIMGPPGSGKTVLCKKIASLLTDITVVRDCPLNCHPDRPDCPWCHSKKKEDILAGTKPGAERIKRIQGSPELCSEDLFGDIDPISAYEFGMRDLRSFVPGKLLKANRGILIADNLNRFPEKTLDIMFRAASGDAVAINGIDDLVKLDVLILATGDEGTLKTLPSWVLEYFDVVRLNYVADLPTESRIVESVLGHTLHDRSLETVRQTRAHADVERGAGTRAALHLNELISSFELFDGKDKNAVIRKSAEGCLPHRLRIKTHAEVHRTAHDIVDEIVSEMTGETHEEEPLVFLSAADLADIVADIAKIDAVRTPLKVGYFDLLLQRMKHFPDLKFSVLHRAMMAKIETLYPERFGGDNLTDELLDDVETARKRAEERDKRLKEQLEREALAQTIELLESQKIIKKENKGWNLDKRGVSFLLQSLYPKIQRNRSFSVEGSHAGGTKTFTGNGSRTAIGKYRFGDRYRSIALRETIRQTIKQRKKEIGRDEIRVYRENNRTRIDVVLVVDLSGTMKQLTKLWYAKESAMALSLLGIRSRDRVGVVAFSNKAERVAKLSGNAYYLTRRILDLNLHENAFTNLGYGLRIAMQTFGRRSNAGNRHIILISDGDVNAPHPSPEKYAIRQARLAARQGITISSICLGGNSCNPELMRKLSIIGRGNIYLVGADNIVDAVLADRNALSA